MVDTKGVGEEVTNYLNQKLGNQSFCEIEPDEFFPLRGVSVEDDVIQFPISRFYAGTKKNIVVFQSTPPQFNWYRFLNMILDVAQDYCHVSEFYTIGSMVSLVAHTAEREILGSYTSSDIKADLTGKGISGVIDYESPPGQRPTLNSFFLWVAQSRNMRAATLWVPVPFYLASMEDPKAQLLVMEFLNRKLNLGLDVGDLNDEVRLNNEMIAQTRQALPEVDQLINRVETGITLSDEENQRLIQEIARSLHRKDA
jgi:proteasome assembly chaperone (PAC2) family protein